MRHSAYLFGLALTCVAGCDEDPAADGPGGDDEPPAVIDATVPLDASRRDAALDAQLPTERDAAPMVDVDASPPPDASLEPATPTPDSGRPNTVGTDASGRTCLGSTTDLLFCAAEQCLPALFEYRNDGAVPYTLACSGCNWGLLPGDPLYVEEPYFLQFEYHFGADETIGARLTFDPALRDARTTEEARAAARGSSIIQLLAIGAEVGVMNATSTTPTVPEVVSYDGHRLHVIVRDEINALLGLEAYPSPPYACGIGDSGGGGLCFTRKCSWHDATQNGSGTATKYVYDFTVELPW